MSTSDEKCRWGQSQARALLRMTASWLEEEHRAGRNRISLLKNMAAVALLTNFEEALHVARAILCESPDSAYTTGVISNIDDLSGLVRPALPDRARAESDFPLYVESDLRAQVFHQAECEPNREDTFRHFLRVFAGELDLAQRELRSDLEREEYASTCALLGHIDRAVEFVRRADFPPDRRLGPRMAACVESFRRGRLEQASELLEELSDLPGFEFEAATLVAAGFIGRVPWPGYPFPDH